MAEGGTLVETPAQRLELLVGEEAIRRLKQACVLIVGIGGVGRYAAEALGRGGIGKLILVDADTVAPSNLNRQIIATLHTLDQPKTEAMAARIRDFAPDCEVIAVNTFFNEQSESLFDQKIDYVIDAIDTLSSKLTLIEMACRHQTPCISSLGIANRFDPTQLTVTTLDKTCNDPLARALRQMVRKRIYRKDSRRLVKGTATHAESAGQCQGKNLEAEISAGQHDLCAASARINLRFGGLQALIEDQDR